MRNTHLGKMFLVLLQASLQTQRLCILFARKGHNPFCPWRSSEVTLNDPEWCSDQELAAAVASRRVGLLGLKQLPVVAESGEEAPDPAGALACAGWEALGTSDAKDFLRCAICLRTHIVQAFAHRARNEENGEPPAKKQRVAESPAPSLWTPQIRVTSPCAVALQVREAAERGWFDPHALHHYYCPLFCRPEERGCGCIACT